MGAGERVNVTGELPGVTIAPPTRMYPLTRPRVKTNQPRQVVGRVGTDRGEEAPVVHPVGPVG